MSSIPKLPDFFIIGAPKCGTTSLAAWLAEHPRVFISPIKEPFYFSVDLNNRFIKEWDDYRRLFKGPGDEVSVVGEASTTYLFSNAAIPLIERELPGSKYIVMIRNPVDMAYSLHEQQLYSNNETVKDFAMAWRLSPARRSGNQVPAHCPEPLLLDYQAFCSLGTQLRRLFSIVPRDRVLVLVLDDIRSEPRTEYLSTLGFLGVPDDGRTDFPVFNAAKQWRSAKAGIAIRWTARKIAVLKHTKNLLPKRSLGLIDYVQERSAMVRVRPPMSPDLRSELRDFYAQDVRDLEAILGREFPAWKAPT